MSKTVWLIASLFTVLFSFVPVYADIAPDPVTRTVSFLIPGLLIGAVVIVSAFLITKFFAKKK